MAIKGAIIGDIVGSQYEFIKPNNFNPKTCRLFSDKCLFTDDTVLTLATKLAIENNIVFSTAYKTFSKKYHTKSYGEKFSEWLNSSSQLPYNSYGNGSAMRVSYIGEKFSTEQEVIDWATQSSICTHDHPEGVKGAVTTAVCIYMAKTGASKSEIYNYSKKQYRKEDYKYSVENSLTSYKDNYIWRDTCQGTVPVAIRCFLESDDYESFLRLAFMLECDMDTVCAIGGGIAEEFYHGTGLNTDDILKEYLDSYLYSIVEL